MTTRRSGFVSAIAGTIRRSWLFAVLLVGPAAPLAAQSAPSVTVWVNSSSHVYHCPGTRYYGNTKRGQFLSEVEAQRLGNRPAGGRTCGPAAPAEAPPAGLRSAAALLSGGAGPDASPPLPADSLLQPCTVTHIKDGDTLECREQGTVRLIGMDSPEDDQPPFGVAATAGLAAILPLNATVRLELDREPRDVYHRLLVDVWWNGELVNWEMVRQGWAVTLLIRPNDRYATELEAAESRARAEGRGLWRVNGFGCRPQEHRRHRC